MDARKHNGRHQSEEQRAAQGRRMRAWWRRHPERKAELLARLGKARDAKVRRRTALRDDPPAAKPTKHKHQPAARAARVIKRGHGVDPSAMSGAVLRACVREARRRVDEARELEGVLKGLNRTLAALRR